MYSTINSTIITTPAINSTSFLSLLEQLSEVGFGISSFELDSDFDDVGIVAVGDSLTQVESQIQRRLLVHLLPQLLPLLHRVHEGVEALHRFFVDSTRVRILSE